MVTSPRTQEISKAISMLGEASEDLSVHGKHQLVCLKIPSTIGTEWDIYIYYDGIYYIKYTIIKFNIIQFNII